MRIFVEDVAPPVLFARPCSPKHLISSSQTLIGRESSVWK